MKILPVIMDFHVKTLGGQVLVYVSCYEDFIGIIITWTTIDGGLPFSEIKMRLHRLSRSYIFGDL